MRKVFIDKPVPNTIVHNEFEKYRIVQDRLMESDFDKALKKLSLTTTKKKK